MKNNFFYKKSLSSIYKKPSKTSEVISQIIYGEKFDIISKKKNWLKIKTSFDNYIGYIKNKNYVDNFKPTHKIFVLKASIFDKKKRRTKKFLTFVEIDYYTKTIIILKDYKELSLEDLYLLVTEYLNLKNFSYNL